MADKKPTATVTVDRRQPQPGGRAQTATQIADGDAKAAKELADRQKKAKDRREALKAAYPVSILNLKLHKGAEERDVVDAMIASAKVWAAEHDYVFTLGEPTTKKTGAIVFETVIDTPESFAAKTRVRGDADKTREVAKAIATALRSDAVKNKAMEIGTTPKDLVLTALQSQFGITIEL